jgi:hypothetical protein
MPIARSINGPYLNFPSTLETPPPPQLLANHNAALTGVTLDDSGNPLGTCTVTLFRQIDDSFVGKTVSDGSGNFTFILPSTSGSYYYRAVDPTGLLVGTTVDTLVGV